MDTEMDIILSATDNASSTFGAVQEAAEQMGSSIETAGDGGLDDVITDTESLEKGFDDADEAVNQMNNDIGIINSAMLMQLGQQVGQLGGQAEDMAHDMDTASISVGQLATQTGIAEPQMVALINTISNATFPNDEAMMYVKSLDQMGVSAENLGESATNIDRINDAFGMGASTTNSLAQELSVLGVDMNDVSSAFNALAYANSNTVGGMQNYFTFLRRYDSQFKELGYDVDQSSIIIAAATQKYGGGRAALTGLSDALKEADGDTRKLEQALGIQAGALDNASAVTGEYEGQLMALANEEAQHKTLLDQIGAAWEDMSLSLSPVLAPLASFVGLMGSVGSFGLQVGGLSTLVSTLRNVTAGLKSYNVVKAITNVLEGEGAIASAAAAVGITTEAAAAEGATVVFGGLAIAEGAVLWPILAIIAALALLAVAVYEVGKYFGWWTDVGDVISAINAGIQRLWSAFINHPDVQGFIQGVNDAWKAMQPFLNTTITTVLRFFKVSGKKDFDIVRVLINALSTAWKAMTLPIRLVISTIQAVWKAFQTMYTKCKEALDNAKKAFDNFKAKVKQIIDKVKDKVKSITNIDISGVIKKIVQPFKDAYEGVKKQVEKIKKKAKEIPSNVGSAGLGILGGAFGGEDLSIYGGSDLTSYSTEKLSVDMNQNINLSLDLRNVPAGMDERQLAGLINETLDSKEFINRLVTNPDFQSLDSKVKTRLNNKRLRAVGGGV